MYGRCFGFNLQIKGLKENINAFTDIILNNTKTGRCFEGISHVVIQEEYYERIDNFIFVCNFAGCCGSSIFANMMKNINYRFYGIKRGLCF